ncbi:hypothetical protein btBTE5EL_001540 (plasmid) [Borrelia turicatae]|nr:hypothetical protein btBTE5EL_001540 [Borrelia turicatae]
MIFERFESFAYQSQEKIQNKQKQISRISKIGRKLPKISRDECFNFNSKVDFSIQKKY